jgi:hypothetical protein
MKYSGGFTLLLSVLVISMILSVSLGITAIILRENRLSTLVLESEFAFHAADRGVDCALFYHLSYDRNTPALSWSPFPTSTVGTGYFYPPNINTATCENTVDDRIRNLFTVSPTSPTSAQTSFRLNFSDGSCVDVRVLNTNSGNDSTITAEGYNTCDTNSPRRTLRVIEVSTNL